MNWLKNLFARSGSGPAKHEMPSDAALITASVVPMPPAVKAEQFADAQAKRQAQHLLYQRIVRSNNAAVTRDLGAAGVVDETLRPRKDAATSPAALTEQELATLRKFDVYERDERDERVIRLKTREQLEIAERNRQNALNGTFSAVKK